MSDDSSTLLPHRPKLRKVLPLAATKSIEPRYLDLPLPDEPQVIPDATSSDFRTISQKSVYQPGIFNCQERSYLREITVSGMKLVWDYDGDRFLRELSKQSDLKRVTIVADSVYINMPLRFPQSEVIIYARELIFTGNGCIDVTPIPNPDSPETGVKVSHSDGSITGKSGANGADAQSIYLNVQSLYIPESTDQQTALRFYARGASGQAGGDGGWLDVKGDPEPARVTWKSFIDKLLKTPLVMFPIPLPATIPKYNPSLGTTYFDTNELVKSPKQKEFQSTHVLHLVMTAHFPWGYFYLRN